MTKSEYLTQLNHKLQVLPDYERTGAMEYYENYLNNAENETAAMAQLGSPGEVAANILANYVARGPAPVRPATRTGRIKTTWMIITAIFALPIGLPLVIALASTAFALFVSLVAVVFAVGVSGVTLVVAGIASIVATPVAMAQSFGFGLLMGGQALLAIGFGILFILGVSKLMGGFPLIARYVGRAIQRRKTPREYREMPYVHEGGNANG